VKALFQKYLYEGTELVYILETLKIKKSRFFQLLKEYKRDPNSFSVQYKRKSATRRISEELEKGIIKELEKEITRYNYHQVHSTTGEAPIIRFERAIKKKKSLFREFKIPSPYTSIKDIYCLRVKRRLNLRLIIRKAFWYTSQGNSRFLQGKARTLREGRSPG